MVRFARLPADDGDAASDPVLGTARVEALFDAPGGRGIRLLLARRAFWGAADPAGWLDGRCAG